MIETFYNLGKQTMFFKNSRLFSTNTCRAENEGESDLTETMGVFT
jgi:hypothetical protein